MNISPNVQEEGAMKEDTGTQDTPYTEVLNELSYSSCGILLFIMTKGILGCLFYRTHWWSSSSCVWIICGNLNGTN